MHPKPTAESILDAIKALDARLDDLEASDRHQWHKLKEQRKYTLLFLILMLIGILVGAFGLEVSDQDEELLTQIAIAAITAGVGGAMAVQSDRFIPPSSTPKRKGDDEWS